MNYSPFNKDIQDLDINELNKLVNNKINEGWYIEYKSRIPLTKQGKLDNLKITKSISSFANTKGGWIFWGVECDINEASGLCGISLNDFKNFQDQLSQIISSNINPKPIFHFKEVPISDEKIVFVIKIEECPTPPYLTSQGVIYQRENNESKPIKDRYIIERLNDKTNNYIEQIEHFSNFDDFGETKGQSDSNQSYLELFLFPKPFNSFSFDKFDTSDFFNTVASRFYQNVECDFNGIEIPLNLGFNSIYSSNDSIIIRPLNDKNLIYKSTTVELFRNGNLKFLIPINEFKAKSCPSHYENSSVLNYLLDKFSPYDLIDQSDDIHNFTNLPKPSPIRERVDSDFTDYINLIDGAELILTILIIISKYKAILNDYDFDLANPIGFRAKITNTWRKFIFFESEDYLEKIKLFNIPLIPKVDIEIPNFKKGHSYNLNLENDNSYLVLSYAILKGIGLPNFETINFQEIIMNTIKRFEKKSG